MSLEGESHVESRTGTPVLRWYHPLVSSARLVGPFIVLLYALDGHSVRDFLTAHFVRILLAAIIAGSAVIYAAIGITRWRRR